MNAWYDMTAPAERDLLVGFYDLNGYVKYARTADPLVVFSLLAGYFDLTAGQIERAGGKFIKAIGDAGLAAFPAEHADTGVRAFLDVQRKGDVWLRDNGYPGRAQIKLNIGPVACGPLGGHIKPFDVIGTTVNIAATLTGRGFTMTPAVFRALEPETRKLFKKHTPPISYIALSDTHRD
ncbi:MAG: adenylate/guanylate cyclase domain-containing protein [Rhodobacteraceae bacterium]|nr:adenylate/guanylate cyclase domain-containing protein [Paracoccaceae bacterium]